MKKDINFVKFVAPKVRQKENEMKFYSRQHKIEKAERRLGMQYTSYHEPEPEPVDNRSILAKMMGWAY